MTEEEWESLGDVLVRVLQKIDEGYVNEQL